MSLGRPLAARIPRSAALDLSAAPAIHGSAADSHAAYATYRPPRRASPIPASGICDERAAAQDAHFVQNLFPRASA